jgi:maltose/moltooligosaccharide transporter
MRTKPALTSTQIWNMCFGFFGLQFGFALQNASVSRIFQTLGATLDQIPALWTAAPLTGLLVQPIIGYYSDRTWTRLGRRRPYMLTGALLAAAALLAMPASRVLWPAAMLLWVLDASINISMEPSRALAADLLAPEQRPRGFATQSFFISAGAIIASMLPWLLTRLGAHNTATGNSGSIEIADTVRWSFYFGALVLLTSVLWTVWRTREYRSDELLQFADAQSAGAADTPRAAQSRGGLLLIAAGLLSLAAIYYWRADRQLIIVAAGILLWGVAQQIHQAPWTPPLFRTLMDDLQRMPNAMRRLIPVQFFSWTALFAMWIYATAAVARQQFGATDALSAAYNDGADWVGVLFAAYNGFAAIAAMIIPRMANRLGLRVTHLLNMCVGGAGLMSFLVIRDPHWLLLSMVGVGFAWASILSLPYALLSDSVPAAKMGVYMGIFNCFIVIPQLLAASVLGLLLRMVFAGNPVYALGLGGVSFVAAGLFALRVPEPK